MKRECLHIMLSLVVVKLILAARNASADLRVLARCAGVEVERLRELNPAIRRMQTPPTGVTELRVPRGAAERTTIELAAIPPGERVLYERHRVRSGEALSTIAARYGVSVRSIQDANGMGRRTLIRVNQVLLVSFGGAGHNVFCPD